MAEKKAPYPGAPPQAPQGFVHGPAQAAYGVAGASPYGVFPSNLYAAAAAAQAQAQAQGPPPTYDQTLGHPAMVGQQMYPPGAAAAAAAAAAQMYAAQGYPGYLGYPPYNPMQAAYYSPLAYAYPGMQPAAAPQFRPAIMVPGAYDAGARFDGIAQNVIPQSPPGVAPNAAQLAAMAGHGVALTQKKGSYLAGGSEGGYTFW